MSTGIARAYQLAHAVPERGSRQSDFTNTTFSAVSIAVDHRAAHAQVTSLLNNQQTADRDARRASSAGSGIAPAGRRSSAGRLVGPRRPAITVDRVLTVTLEIAS